MTKQEQWVTKSLLRGESREFAVEQDAWGDV